MEYNDLFMNQDLSSAEKVSCYVVRVANAFQDLLARTEKAESDAKYWKSIAENWEYIFHNESNARREAEAHVLELETSHRTELCDSGFECVELGKVRKALAEAESRAEKAERERDAAVADLRLVSDCRTCGNVSPWCIDNPDKCKGWEWRGRKEE